MRKLCALLLLCVFGVEAAQSQPVRRPASARVGEPYMIDPVTYRIWSYCKQDPRCIRKQHQGIQIFLSEITKEPRPSMGEIHRCTQRATKRTFTDWPAAARCLR